MSRYDRQELIDGWEQNRLSNSKVAVVGGGILSDYVAMTLAALGFGQIELYYAPPHRAAGAQGGASGAEADRAAAGGDGFPKRLTGKASDVGSISELARKINPLVNVHGLELDMGISGNIRAAGRPDLIIEATNNPSSKYNVLEYASLGRIPVVSMSSDNRGAAMGLFLPEQAVVDRRRLLKNLLFTDMMGGEQAGYGSSVMAGAGAEEARKIVMPIRDEKTLEDILVYSLDSAERFTWPEQGGRGGGRGGNRGEGGDAGNTGLRDYCLKDKKILMIGAGALGNFAGLGFALAGIGELQIADFDRVEETNLNRQVLFYDSIGDNKSRALSAKLGRISPSSKLVALDERIGPGSERLFSDGRFDLVVDCVDNNKSRALINYFTQKHRIPFISGGTRFNSGQVTVSAPGKTACLNCQSGIDQAALSAYRPTSCIYAPEPSVINSNEIIGGIMVGEAINLLSGGEPPHKILKYSSQEELRLGMIPSAEMCGCYKDNKMLDGWMERMGHLYRQG